MLLTEILIVACLVVALILSVAVAHCISRINQLEDDLEQTLELLCESTKTLTEPLVFLMEDHIQSQKNQDTDNEEA